MSACDEDAVLHDIERILKPGGALLVIDFGNNVSAPLWSERAGKERRVDSGKTYC